MTRLVVHGGFHGPDAAALNRLMHDNHHELRAAGLRVLHPVHMITLEGAVEGTCTPKSPLDPVRRGRNWAAEVLTPERTRNMTAFLLTGERLTGPMLGSRDVTDFDPLPAAIEGVMSGVAEAGHELALHFTLSPPEVFLDHCHWTLMTRGATAMTRAAFRDRFHASADLIGVVEQIRAGLDPIPVTWVMAGGAPDPRPLYHAAGLDPAGIVDLLPPPRRRRNGYTPALEADILALHDDPTLPPGSPLFYSQLDALLRGAT